MVGIRSYIIDLTFFFDLSKDIIMATNFRGENDQLIFIHAVAFWNRWEYCDSDLSIQGSYRQL